MQKSTSRLLLTMENITWYVMHKGDGKCTKSLIFHWLKKSLSRLLFMFKTKKGHIRSWEYCVIFNRLHRRSVPPISMVATWSSFSSNSTNRISKLYKSYNSNEKAKQRRQSTGSCSRICKMGQTPAQRVPDISHWSRCRAVEHPPPLLLQRHITEWPLPYHYCR